jgi:hypothetical protein
LRELVNVATQRRASPKNLRDALSRLLENKDQIEAIEPLQPEQAFVLDGS